MLDGNVGGAYGKRRADFPMLCASQQRRQHERGKRHGGDLVESQTEIALGTNLMRRGPVGLLGTCRRRVVAQFMQQRPLLAEHQTESKQQ